MAPADLPRFWPPFVVITAVICIMTFFFGVVIDAPSHSQFSKVRRLCDQAVEALLNSKDLVEVTRAGLIVRHLDCSISRRLP